MKRNEESLRELWDNIRQTDICIVGVPEGEEKEKGPEKIFKEIILPLTWETKQLTSSRNHI